MWKDIPEFDGYRISNEGLLQSCFVRGSRSHLSAEWREVQAHESNNGYMQVTLYRRGARHLHRIHVLVLLSFVGPRPSGFQACHLNGNRKDNCLSNLRWDSVSANHADKNTHGTMSKGSRHGQSRLNETQIVEIRSLFGDGVPTKEIGRRFGVSATAIHWIKTGRTWSHIR